MLMVALIQENPIKFWLFLILMYLCMTTKIIKWARNMLLAVWMHGLRWKLSFVFLFGTTTYGCQFVVRMCTFFVFFFVFLVIWGVKDITFFLTSTTIKDVCLWCIFISFALTFLVNGDVKVLYKKATFLMIGTSTHGFQFLVQSYGILFVSFLLYLFQ